MNHHISLILFIATYLCRWDASLRSVYVYIKKLHQSQINDLTWDFFVDLEKIERVSDLTISNGIQ